MARVAFKMRLKPGCEAIYQEKHDAVWPEVAALIRRTGIRNYSIHRLGLDLFAYYETDEPTAPLATGGAIDPVQRDWWLMMEPYMEYNDDHTPTIWPMTEMFYQE
ncbi:MAG: L-rhamnose mutarotase [Chloroflexia bacterium]|nr:L-rhamnose mutarotase [Chloroflexia bacterium]MDQ3410543.1 L-rhamnose mutarotase [Chloroflexota bacterium]